MKGLRELVGDDVVTRPEDARSWHQREDAADEEHRDGTLPTDRLKQRGQRDQSRGTKDDLNGRHG